MAKSLVTAKEFWSAAADGVSSEMPTALARVCPAARVAATSPDAGDVASAPFFLLLRNVVNVARYSGTTSTPWPADPASSAGSVSSRLPTTLTVGS